MKKILILSVLFFSNTIFADQAEVVPDQIAREAAAILSTKDSVKFFCKPCNDKKAVLQKITSLSVLKSDSLPQHSQIIINGQTVDLAYIYIPDKSDSGVIKWVNLALYLSYMGVDVTGVDYELNNK